MQCSVKLIIVPGSDTGRTVGRDVRRVERAERRRHRQATGEQRSAGIGVAGDAIPGTGEIFASGNRLLVISARRGKASNKQKQ
jgi:hypothetical protein